MNEVCDRHASAKAQARMLLPSGATLYLCGHCSRTLDYSGEFTIEYDEVRV